MNLEKLTEDLRAVLNKNSVDSYLAIPDHILADHLVRTITGLRDTNRASEEWHAGAKRVYADSDDSVFSKVTKRERDIILMITTGHRVRQIAAGLDISHHTVRNHLKAIYRKLDIGSQLELITMVVGK